MCKLSVLLFSNRYINSIGRVRSVETVSLSRIVMMLTPELYPFLKRNELDFQIVLANGIDALVAEDAVEIIQHSIYEHQKDARLH
jgi:hypothetical protein